MSAALLIPVLFAASLSLTGGVKVSERFGYDPEDSTRFLQAALDSGLPKIIIDRREKPWRTLPLKGTSNQMVVFEPGVRLEAKRGAFKDPDDVLLSYALATNVTLSGYGAEIRMWKSDYTNASLYAWSEWRHAIEMRSCQNVTIEGLTVAGSGGDGLYLGQRGGRQNSGIVVRDVRFLDNDRQGVSVITADGLLIENCEMSGTWGTPPAAGIDFEPNNPQQMLRNCRVRNCTFVGNQGRGVEVSKWNLNSTSEPMDIEVESCILSGNVTRVEFHSERNPFRDVGGKVTFRNCKLLDPAQTPDSLRNTDRKYTSFVVGCENCTVRDPSSPRGTAVMNESWPKLPMVDEDYWNELRVVPLEFPRKVEVVDGAPGMFVNVEAPYFRSLVSFFVYAEKPGAVSVKVVQLKMGKRPLWTGASEVLDASGRRIAELPAPGAEETVWRFEAPARGFYEIRATVGSHALGVLATTAPIAAVGGEKGFRNAVPLAMRGGDLYFDVPQDTKRFVAAVSGGTGRERVSARLLDAQGALVDEVENLSDFKSRFVGGCPPSGLWKIECRKPVQGAFEDYSVDLLGLPTVFFLTPEKRWIDRTQKGVELPADIAGKCETWLCAGQSNMQTGWDFYGRTPEEKVSAERELAQLADVDIRFWDFADGGWKRLCPDNARDKCAFGIGFAIRRAKASGKPIALLYVAAGGAPTEAFLSKTLMGAREWDGECRYPKLAAMMDDGREIDDNPHFPCAWVAREYPRRKGCDPEAKWWGFGCLYEKGIAPVRNLPLTGILWYQGESNATACIGQPDRALDPDYMRETLRAVVAELRGERPIPFLMVGLPRMNRPWEAYRAAQKEVCSQTGAIYVDTFSAGLGEDDDVHPRDKVAFAELAATAAAKALAACGRVVGRQTLWRSGADGVRFYRIPALATAPNGDLVAVCDARFRDCRDLHHHFPIRTSVRRSKDGGRTWSAPVFAQKWPWDEQDGWSASDPSLVVDAQAGKVFLFCNVWRWDEIPNYDKEQGVYHVYVQESADNGETWGEAREITRDIAPDHWPVGKTKGEDAFLLVPSGSGTQLEDGTLLHVIAWIGHSVAVFGSSDHGRTWKSFGRPTEKGGGDESKVIELPDGGWMVNQRWSGGPNRFVNVTHDRGQTWEPRIDETLTDPACNGQLMRYGSSVLFSNCASTRRENIRVRRSRDGGRTWNAGISVCPGPGKYSDMTILPNGDIGILYEEGPVFDAIRFAVLKVSNTTKGHEK